MKRLLNTFLIYGSFVFCECLPSSSDEVTLTTARERNTASPKPNRFYRRINVERPQDLSSTPLDLFRVKDPERRSHMDAVWKWDFWCQLQPKNGNCTATRGQEQHTKKPKEIYYYDAQLDTCLTFMFTGCDGNKNSFQTLMECESHCKGSAYMTVKETVRTTYCGLQPNAGLCMGLNQRYYYDVNGDECKTFVYGGCGGNQNRFKTKFKCEDRCKESAERKTSTQHCCCCRHPKFRVPQLKTQCCV